jgi:hypothetical protein
MLSMNILTEQFALESAVVGGNVGILSRLAGLDVDQGDAVLFSSLLSRVIDVFWAVASDL